jgi:hypothetical protein
MQTYGKFENGKVKMQTSPLTVRRNQISISAEKRGSAAALFTQSVSDHIDRQRRHVLELEREALSLESEIRSLKKQTHDIEEAIKGKNDSPSAVQVLRWDIAQATRSLVLLCTTYMSEAEKSEQIVMQIIAGMNDTPKSRLKLSLPIIDRVMCFSIVDRPGPQEVLHQFLRSYESAICEIVEIPDGDIAISIATPDKEEVDALKLVFSVTREAADRLASRIEELATQAHAAVSKDIQTLLSVTRTVVIDTDSGGSSPSKRINNVNSPKSVTKPVSPPFPVHEKTLHTVPESSVGPPRNVMSAQDSAPDSPTETEDSPRSPSVRERISALEKMASGPSREPDIVSGSLRMASNYHRQTASFFDNNSNLEPSATGESATAAATRQNKSGWGIKAPTPERRPSTVESSVSQALPSNPANSNATLILNQATIAFEQELPTPDPFMDEREETAEVDESLSIDEGSSVRSRLTMRSAQPSFISSMRK